MRFSKRKNVVFVFSLATSLLALSLYLLFNKTLRYKMADAATNNNYTLTINSFSWKNTYFAYANTQNGNKITFERESRWNNDNYNLFINYTPIHYIKSITATFSTTSTVKIAWNKATQTSSYTDIPHHGLGENSYYSYATIKSGQKYTFSYDKVFYFALWDEANSTNLGITKLVINYYC